MCDRVLTTDSEFESLLPRRQGLGLGATALTSYLIALHNRFIYALAKYTNIEQKYALFLYVLTFPVFYTRMY